MEVTADFVFARLHGPDDAYRDQMMNAPSPSGPLLSAVGIGRGKKIYRYFDSDEAACAVDNAMHLQEALATVAEPRRRYAHINETPRCQR